MGCSWAEADRASGRAGDSGGGKLVDEEGRAEAKRMVEDRKQRDRDREEEEGREGER